MLNALDQDIGTGAAHQFLGGTEPASASPLWMVDAEFDALIVHGTHDDRVPVEQSRKFTARHHHATLLELPDAGHFDYLDPGNSAWQQVADNVIERLQ